MPFTDIELSFLRRHGFSPEDVYDGRYQAKDIWQEQARDAGKILVLGSRCRAYGHRIRTRAGHCAQCDPKKIAYQRRYSSPGFVYIAGSLSGRVVKIGTASDLSQRESNLRGQRYGGLGDWIVIYAVAVNEGGRIERNARERLWQYKASRLYYKDGLVQEAGELLRCSFSRALAALSGTIGANGRPVFKSQQCWRYEFDESDAPAA